MAKLEHHSPEYLKINPNGVIPTLIHDGRPLHESGTICEYLDESFPDPPLRPDAPYERALMRNWIRHIDGLIHNLIIFNWRHHLQKISRARSARNPGCGWRASPTPAKNATRHGPNWSCCWTRWRTRWSRPAGWSAKPIPSRIYQRFLS